MPGAGHRSSHGQVRRAAAVPGDPGPHQAVPTSPPLLQVLSPSWSLVPGLPLVPSWGITVPAATSLQLGHPRARGCAECRPRAGVARGGEGEVTGARPPPQATSIPPPPPRDQRGPQHCPGQREGPRYPGMLGAPLVALATAAGGAWRGGGGNDATDACPLWCVPHPPTWALLWGRTPLRWAVRLCVTRVGTGTHPRGAGVCSTGRLGGFGLGDRFWPLDTHTPPWEPRTHPPHSPGIPQPHRDPKWGCGDSTSLPWVPRIALGMPRPHWGCHISSGGGLTSPRRPLIALETPQPPEDPTAP